jgi:translocation and assembly module TamB
VLIPQKEPFPIIFEGVQVGTLDGRFQIAGSRAHDGSRFDVDVEVPTTTMQLPLTAAHAVQPLGTLAGVQIGRTDAAGKYTVLSLEGTITDETPAEAPAMPVRMVVKLGNAVEVKRGTDLDLYLSGGPIVTFSDKVTVSGQIRITRGRLSVQGKPFDVEKGTVSFVGDDPSDPQVMLTAGWTAPDGSRVYADFAGPLKTGKVELRSEPPRPQNEIIALIVTGSADQGVGSVSASQTTPGAGATTAGTVAAGAAGATATAPINQALGNVNRVLDNFGVVGGLSTNIDTSQANPRPEVELQIARDISLQLAVVLGVPPPGASQDTTYVTLDWRFLSKWSLRATYGNLGTSILDVVWQHRY